MHSTIGWHGGRGCFFFSPYRPARKAPLLLPDIYNFCHHHHIGVDGGVHGHCCTRHPRFPHPLTSYTQGSYLTPALFSPRPIASTSTLTSTPSLESTLTSTATTACFVRDSLALLGFSNGLVFPPRASSGYGSGYES